MGPLNQRMKKEMAERQGDIKYEVEWTTLDEYLRFLERRGVSCNVASFIGAATPRIYVIGHEDRAPTPDELGRMREPGASGDGRRGGRSGVRSCLSAGILRQDRRADRVGQSGGGV